MVDIIFEDGPLKGKVLRNTALPEKTFLCSKDGVHFYYFRRRIVGKIPMHTTEIELQRVYGHVKNADTK